MATRICQLKRVGQQILQAKNKNGGKILTPSRNIQVYTDTGAICSKPADVKPVLGSMKALGVVIPFLYVGATISKNGASFLEENDIFVPDDDDD